MPKSQTHEPTNIVAHFLQTQRRVSTVYRVLIPLPCSQCNKIMQVGELFSKQRPNPYYYLHTQIPFCRDCSPFREKKSPQIDDSLQPKLFE